MIVVLDATIGIGVCIPFTIGKCLALLSVGTYNAFSLASFGSQRQQLEPRRLLHLVDFPIRAIRVITDPVVDSFMFFFVQAILPPLKHATSIAVRPFNRLVIATVGEQTIQRAIELSTMAVGLCLYTQQSGSNDINPSHTVPTCAGQATHIGVVSYPNTDLHRETSGRRLHFYAVCGALLCTTGRQTSDNLGCLPRALDKACFRRRNPRKDVRHLLGLRYRRDLAGHLPQFVNCGQHEKRRQGCASRGAPAAPCREGEHRPAGQTERMLTTSYVGCGLHSSGTSRIPFGLWCHARFMHNFTIPTGKLPSTDEFPPVRSCDISILSLGRGDDVHVRLRHAMFLQRC